jgi:peptide/nickel transport system substrate-binding protein
MTRESTWRRAIALAFAAALVLGACSSSDDGDATGTSGTASGEASDMDANGVLKVGYDLSQSGVDWDFNPLEFVTGSSASNDALWSLVYARLMRPLPDGSIEPDLAAKAEIVDRNTISIELQPNLTFSDGSVLDANAVKTSFETVLAAEATNANGYLPAFYKLKSVTVSSPTSLTFGFPDGTAASWYDQYMATWGSSIFKFGGDPDLPIGAGPFIVTSYQPGQVMNLSKNAGYHDPESVNFAGIEIRSIPFAQANSALAALQSGQVDFTFTEPALLDTLSGRFEPASKVSPNSAAMMHMCKKDGPLADARVRQAINKGMDRDAISEAVYAGTAEPQTESWPEGHRLWNPDVAEVLAYDPERAKELLTEAGYPNGFSMDMYPIAAFNLDETAEVIKDQLSKIGITVNIVPTPDYVNQFLFPNAAGVGLYPSNVPGAQKVTAWTGDSMGNVCDFTDPEVNELYAELTGVSEQSEEAVDIWFELDRLVAEEALSGFIVFRADVGAYNTDRIGDLELWPLGTWLIPNPFVSYIKAGS